MKKAGYEVVDELLYSLIDGKERSINEVAEISGLEWSLAKSYLENMVDWGLVDIKGNGQKKVVINSLAKNRILSNVSSEHYPEKVASIFKRICQKSGDKKANKYLRGQLRYLNKLYGLNFLEKEDIIGILGLLFMQLSEIIERVDEDLQRVLARPHLEHHHFRRHPELYDEIIGDVEAVSDQG